MHFILYLEYVQETLKLENEAVYGVLLPYSRAAVQKHYSKKKHLKFHMTVNIYCSSN